MIGATPHQGRNQSCQEEVSIEVIVSKRVLCVLYSCSVSLVDAIHHHPAQARGQSGKLIWHVQHNQPTAFSRMKNHTLAWDSSHPNRCGQSE